MSTAPLQATVVATPVGGLAIVADGETVVASGFTTPPQASGEYHVQPISTVRCSSWTSR